MSNQKDELITLGVFAAMWLGIVAARIGLGMYFFQSFTDAIGKDFPGLLDAVISILFFEVTFVLWIVSFFI